MSSEPTNSAPTPHSHDHTIGATVVAVAKAAKRPWTMWRRLRWSVRLAIAIPVLTAIVVLVLMRSPLVGGTVRGMIKDATGADLHASSIYIGVDGRLVMENPSLRVPGMETDAAEVMSARRAVIDLDWKHWRTSGIKPVSLRLDQPVFRFSQSLDDQGINLAGLTSAAMKANGEKKDAGGGGAMGGMGGRPPQIDIMDGRIEFADHSERRGTFEIHHTIQVAGSLVPMDPVSGLYTLRLQEIGRAPPVSAGLRGMILDGKIDLGNDHYVLRLLNLPLDGFPPDAIPAAYRSTWKRLNFRGRVNESTFTYTRNEGVKLDLALQGVSVDVPIQGYATTEMPNPAASLTISDVNGEISLAKAGLSVDLTGLLEGQTTSSRVKLQTEGLDINGAMRCEITGRRLSVERNPSFFPYVPDKVREYFTAFSGPTAEFDARVVVTRGAPVSGVPAPIRIADGRLVFRNGTAAFHKFPYRFHDLSGSVEFTENRLEFTELHGLGPTGAVMTATALIEPLSDDAAVRVQLTSRNTPVDRFLLDAMPAGDRRVIETLFAREDYDEMVAQGLVISSRARARLERDLEDLRGLLEVGKQDPARYAAEIEAISLAIERAEPRLKTPIFDLAGNANVEVLVTSPMGKDSPWFIDVDVDFPTAGLLPEPFPYPIVAKDFRLKVSPERAQLISGEFAGVRGGTVSLTADVVLEEAGVRCVKPDIRISASKIPVDELLIAAVPDTSPDTDEAAVDPNFVGPPTRPLSAQVICQTLDVRGTIDATAAITADPDAAAHSTAFVSDLQATEPTTPEDPVTYDATVVLDGLTAGPEFADESAAIRLANLRGSMSVTPKRIKIEGLGAELLRSASKGPIAAAANGAPLLAKLNVNLLAGLEGDESLRAGSVRAEVEATSVDLGAPLEQFIALFNDDAGSFLTNIRSELAPTGHLDLAMRFEHDEPVLGATREGSEEGNDVREVLTAARDLREFTFSNVRNVEMTVPELLGGAVTESASGAGTTSTLGRLRLDCPEGSFRLADELHASSSGNGDERDRLAFTFNQLMTELTFEGDSAGTVLADGAFTLRGNDGVLVRPAAVKATVRSARLESRLIRRLVTTVLSADSAKTFESLDFHGTFDADAAVTGLEGRTDGLAQISAVVTPRSLTFFDGTERVELPPVAGTLSARAAQTGPDLSWQAAGRFRGIEVQAPDLSALIEGEWAYGRDTGARVDAQLDLKAESLTERHSKLMPVAVRKALESLEVKLTGPWSLSPARLVIESGTMRDGEAGVRTGIPGGTMFEGRLAFSEGQFEAGVPITDASGRVEIRARAREGESSPEFDIHVRSADFRVAGAKVTDANALISSAAGSDRVEISYATGASHGGRVWASGEILSTDSPSQGDGVTSDEKLAPARYKVDIVAAGVAFAPLMDELSKGTSAVARVVESARKEREAAATRVVRRNGSTDFVLEMEEEGVTGREAPDQSRGLVDARLSLEGRTGDPQSRVGRGSVRIASGSVLRLPVVFQLMQLSNFALPTGDKLDYMQAGFHMEGSTATFEQVALLSDSIALLGSGTMTFPSLELDMTFNSRGTNRIPLISDLYEVLRNEIVTTRIKGPLEDPSIQSQPFVGTRRALDRLFNSDSHAMDPMSVEAFDAVWRERERYRALLRPDAPAVRPVIEPMRSGVMPDWSEAAQVPVPDRE